MNICEILKAIEQNTNDINSIKNNSESVGIYLVVIRVRPSGTQVGRREGGGQSEVVFDILKGDYETTLSKLQMGEYIDMKVFFWDPNNKMEELSTVKRVSTEVFTEDEVAIIIDMGLNNYILVWTSEGITEPHS